jgi:hypothetical protein
MQSDFPAPIDDSIPQEVYQEEEEIAVEPRRYYYAPEHPQIQQTMIQQPQKKSDIFSELDRMHWIILVSVILLAFFVGKSMSTPIIIRGS